ncbi:hypothetical protein [Alloalcanivorax marinus]|uniref:hypothetical protein n=1 Tax=Alloalcanivorax marinus TaxID=1177169 RepID=UPI001956560E|nr:hypothetical protein [Alloalcanivorax marinus]MBM7335268.1 hypothetical protein [Alloalcanivorax marinus]
MNSQPLRPAQSRAAPLWSPVRLALLLSALAAIALLGGCGGDDDDDDPVVRGPSAEQGRQVFRYETFGNQRFWTDAMQLPQGIAGAQVTPLQALGLGLNVNVGALSAGTAQALLTALDEVENGAAPEDTALGDPAVTLLLINEGAVIGVVPFDENGDRKPLGSDAAYDGMDALDIAGGDKVGVTCALCHAKTDGSVVPAGTVGPGSVGAETDGVIAGGLDVGAIFAAADNPLAYLPLLQLQFDALEGATIGKGDFTGIASGGTVADATAAARTYLTGTFEDGGEEKRYYGTTSFDATPDGIGNATYFPPFFRTDLAAPWGHSGAFAELNDFNNLVYTVALDPTSLLTADGRAFLNVLAGPVGDEIADRYEAVLRDTGVIPDGMAVADVLPYVDVARTDLAPGSAAGPVGRRVSDARLADLAAYTDRLAAPPAPGGLDANLVSQGETLFTSARADGGAGCAGCHTANPNQPVKEVIIPIATLYPGYGMPPVILDRSGAGLTPIQNSTAGPAPSYDDSVVVLDASVRGEVRGEAKPLLLGLNTKLNYLHDGSVGGDSPAVGLEALLNPARGADSPHPFYFPRNLDGGDDQAGRDALVEYLLSRTTD